MSPRFASDDIDEVRERADIIEVVGEHVRLKRMGTSWKGLCPFHQEKTPSFTVDPAKKVWFCLGGETRVLTADGARAIGDLAGTAQRVLTIAGGGGTWVDAPFHSFGLQRVFEVTLTRNGLEKSVYATPEHRWFIRPRDGKGRGKEITTRTLLPGQTLKSCFPRSPMSFAGKRPLVPSPFGIARGVTFGDGARLNKGSVAYLYGQKDAELRRFFPQSDSYEETHRTTITDLPAHFKDALPSLDESPAYLYGWLAGYFAADGDIAVDGCMSINSVDRSNLEYVRNACARLGVATYGIREYRRKGFARISDDGSVGHYEGPVYRLTLAGADLTPEFFLLSGHRARFEAHKKKFERRHWVVQSVEESGKRQEVFCPVVPRTHAFALEDNILTGNCHGCQRGGSLFTFVEEIEGLSFPEAVEALARRYNVQLREVAGGAKKAPSQRSRLSALQELAVEKYKEFLKAKDAEPVRAYLESRGITPEIVDRYSIGFGGWRRDALVHSMMRRGFNGNELQTAGLATRDNRGPRDMFFGRVVFPIFDPSGRPVGMGGRVLPPEHRAQDVPDAPKYLNSRESPIFKKSRILYGTNWARADVVQRKRLVLVEGYTDVIALHSGGIGEAVATCGTALTEDHMKEISTRFGDVRVVLCLDSDAAGQAAMSRERTEDLAGAYSPGGEVRGAGWVPIGRGWLPEVHVATLPQGKDPADYVRAEGPEGVGRIVDTAVPLVEFLLRRSLEGADLETPDGRAGAVRKGVDVLRQVGDSLLRHEYALWLADRAGIDPYEVTRALDAGPRPTQRHVTTGPAPKVAVVLTGHHRIEREALRAMLAFPRLMRDEQLELSEQDFTLPLHRSLFRLASVELTEQGTVDAGRLAARVQDEELRSIASELSFSQVPDSKVARDTLARLKVFTFERHIVERKGRLRTLDPDRDGKAYDALFEELLELEKRKRELATTA